MAIQCREVDCPFDLPNETTSHATVRRGYLVCEKFRDLIKNFLLKDFAKDEAKRIKEKTFQKHSPKEGQEVTENTPKDEPPHPEDLSKKAGT